MIFLETSFLINFHVPKVQNHEIAKKIFYEIEDKQKAISKMTIYETLTVLRKLKQDDEKLKSVYHQLVNSDDIKVFEDIPCYEQALSNTFINNIGFFDNLTYVVMTKLNIEEIASFDPDFDIFKDIKRIH
jgi:predicted nucleic acid-binding protein